MLLVISHDSTYPSASVQSVRRAGEYSAELRGGSEGSTHTERASTVRAELGGLV